MTLTPLERYREIIDDWAAFAEAARRPLPVSLWPHPERLAPEALPALLGAAATASLVPGFWRLPGDQRMGGRWEFFAGLYQLVEETSALAALALDPRPGERVLDLCAAPGMKSLLLAAAMENRGTIVANDLNHRRLKGLRQSIERFGATAICVTQADGANLPPAVGSFDRVLVDAPCSCEGTLRKHPEVLRGTLDRAFSLRQAGVQKALLRKALQLCRPGGRIVYSTCTFAPEENECVIDAVLREQPGRARVVAPALPAGIVTAPGLTSWHGEDLLPELQHACRLWPHYNDTGGFFLCTLEVAADAEALPPVPPTARTAPEPAILQTLAERFGMPPRILRELPLHAADDGRVYWCTAEALPPAPVPRQAGLPLIRTSVSPPKLTVPGALAIGHHATSNRLAIDATQAQAYLRRECFAIGSAAGCTPGYVLLEQAHQILGTGLLQEAADGTLTVRSLFPRRWKPSRRGEPVI